MCFFLPSFGVLFGAKSVKHNEKNTPKIVPGREPAEEGAKNVKTRFLQYLLGENLLY